MRSTGGDHGDDGDKPQPIKTELQSPVPMDTSTKLPHLINTQGNISKRGGVGWGGCEKTVKARRSWNLV